MLYLGETFEEVKNTLRSFGEAFEDVRRADLRKYYILPGILGIILFFLTIALGFGLFELITRHVNEWGKLGKFRSLAAVVMGVLAFLLVAAVYFLIYKTLLLLILTPLMSRVSERTDSFLTGREYRFTLRENLRFIGRGVKIGLICFVKQAALMLALFLLEFVIPPLAVFNFITVFLIQGYFTGYTFMDYTLERYGFSSKESLRYLKEHAVLSTTAGALFNLGILVPVAGIFIAPLVTCVAVTKLTVREMGKT
ncbi:MAG: EI24 domain-containing protein [Fusobacteriaceae bacterium]|jgi:CysZ protein|nr:EI24 domain-containing protein [Fusobacteriaceae bacterium]